MSHNDYKISRTVNTQMEARELRAALEVLGFYVGDGDGPRRDLGRRHVRYIILRGRRAADGQAVHRPSRRTARDGDAEVLHDQREGQTVTSLRLPPKPTRFAVHVNGEKQYFGHVWGNALANALERAEGAETCDEICIMQEIIDEEQETG